jgi:two-component system chemotaxis response regulator CheY
MKILVVDDSSTMRRIIVNTLGRLGYKDVVQAADGVEAWEALQANPDIGVVITDWNMPNMNGLELVKKIRAQDKYKAMPLSLIHISEPTRPY